MLYLKTGAYGSGGMLERPEYADLRQDWVEIVERMKAEYGSGGGQNVQ